VERCIGHSDNFPIIHHENGLRWTPRVTPRDTCTRLLRTQNVIKERPALLHAPEACYNCATKIRPRTVTKTVPTPTFLRFPKRHAHYRSLNKPLPIKSDNTERRTSHRMITGILTSSPLRESACITAAWTILKYS
jgi:hypothetical protein